jgi:hypothetical protein
MTKQHPVRGEIGRFRWFFWEFRYAMYNNSNSWRATLLIFAIGFALHSPFGYTLIVYVGYLICECLDQMKKARVIEYEMEGWEADPDESEYENKGNLSRVRLTGQNQVVAYRVANLLKRMR